jgi:hypothetical protein
MELSRTTPQDKGRKHSAGVIRRATLTWLILLGLTTLSFRLSTTVSGNVLMFTVLGLTLIKGHLVTNEFMGLRHTRWAWRLVMAIYLLSVGSIIAFAYLSA